LCVRQVKVAEDIITGAEVQEAEKPQRVVWGGEEPVGVIASEML
jgi:hypothetical protein